MLKQMTVAVCDICGNTEHAKLVFDSRNDYIYTLPEVRRESGPRRALRL